jgi:hypothetical protein
VVSDRGANLRPVEPSDEESSRADAVKRARFEAAKEKIFCVHAELFRRLAE